MQKQNIMKNWFKKASTVNHWYAGKNEVGPAVDPAVDPAGLACGGRLTLNDTSQDKFLVINA